ncbi:alpha/beta hydrolase [Variovorax sp. M-6]|uniref:alpha/beta hydrolase n=1 Tax=Variovorax sp. M-6 TaxID=3233041 RepID=UPI003F9514B3
MNLLRRASRPESLTAQLREIGTRWQQDIRAAGDRTKALYLPLLAAAPQQGWHLQRDLRYGEHPGQVLDLYRPSGAHRAPVVVFVHGGAFVRGAKNINAQMYGNVLAWFARHGCVGVNVEYRLAPEAVYPAGAHDVAAACQWVDKHVADWGGDPARICLIGHSAGGTHAATYVYDPVMEGTGQALRCLVLISARLRADNLPENPNAAGVEAYFGSDPARYAARSPLSHAARSAIPLLLATAEYENPLLDLYGLEFALEVARAQRRAPRYLTLAEHNHVSIVAHFNTQEALLGEQILEFFEAN